MEGYLEETLAVSKLGATRSREWMHRVITLLEAAVGHEHPAQGTLLEAASLLRQQIHAPAAEEVPDGRGRLLAWQARKVRDYIDSHITGPVPVADLCGLVQRSEGHFSRSFKRTFGESPHSFVVRRRVELAAAQFRGSFGLRALSSDTVNAFMASRRGLELGRDTNAPRGRNGLQKAASNGSRGRRYFPRVASAVGEGSSAIGFVHQALSE
jgi:hypothetical protein